VAFLESLGMLEEAMVDFFDASAYMFILDKIEARLFYIEH
jgi:hypothetical protein